MFHPLLCGFISPTSRSDELLKHANLRAWCAQLWPLTSAHRMFLFKDYDTAVATVTLRPFGAELHQFLSQMREWQSFFLSLYVSVWMYFGSMWTHIQRTTNCYTTCYKYFKVSESKWNKQRRSIPVWLMWSKLVAETLIDSPERSRIRAQLHSEWPQLWPQADPRMCRATSSGSEGVETRTSHFLFRFTWEQLQLYRKIHTLKRSEPFQWCRFVKDHTTDCV